MGFKTKALYVIKKVLLKYMPDTSVARILLLAILLLFTDQNLYPYFNYKPVFKDYLRDTPFREYNIYEDTSLVWPEMISAGKNPAKDSLSVKHAANLLPDRTVFEAFSQDSSKKQAQWVYNAMFPFKHEKALRSLLAEKIPAENEEHIASAKSVDSLAYLNFEIMGEGKLTEQQMHSFFLSNSDSAGISRLSDKILLYMQECRAEGVNHDIAFIQMCHETGFLKYNGVVSADQNNFCGLGTVNNDTPGESFKTAREGIRAHIQHLKAYASHDTLNNKLIDKRFDFVERGSAKVIKELTGKWAADPKYDRKLLGLIIRAEDHNNTSLL